MEYLLRLQDVRNVFQDSRTSDSCISSSSRFLWLFMFNRVRDMLGRLNDKNSQINLIDLRLNRISYSHKIHKINSTVCIVYNNSTSEIYSLSRILEYLVLTREYPWEPLLCQALNWYKLKFNIAKYRWYSLALNEHSWTRKRDFYKKIGNRETVRFFVVLRMVIFFPLLASNIPNWVIDVYFDNKKNLWSQLYIVFSEEWKAKNNT